MYFYPDSPEKFREKALRWASGFDTYMFVNGNRYDTLHGCFPEKLAVGARRELKADDRVFEQLDAFAGQPHGWIFGYLSYDVKNETEALNSQNPDRLAFPTACFFEPEVLVSFFDHGVHIEADDAIRIYDEINSSPAPFPIRLPRVTFCPETGRNDYLRTGRLLRSRIVEGDIYEINYCVRYYAEQVDLSPLSAYWSLNGISPAPFSLLFESGGQAIMSASPERFLKKTGDRLVSQPMKGTIRRGSTIEEDESLKAALRASEKEIAENMMIMDLVRNDLARVCKSGSVVVEDLFGVYTFPKVHQMITTIAGDTRLDSTIGKILRATFPMGSMTGAPKIRAMELIDQYEAFYRGAFSGAAGYITPDNDFDFNVLIRSLFYNKSDRHLSFGVGSAITYDCELEKEWEECQLKAGIFRQLFGE